MTACYHRVTVSGHEYTIMDTDVSGAGTAGVRLKYLGRFRKEDAQETLLTML